MFIDGLIILTEKMQVELLQKYLSKLWNIYSSDYGKIKKIVQSNNIEKIIKNIFLKSAFEKSDAETQYKMLFEDNLIDIQNETIESQIEYLQKYLLKLGKINLNYSNYDKIKSIAQSAIISKISKNVFFKSAFEIADSEYQYKILFDDNLIDIQNETPESQIEYLQKYLSNIRNISSSYEKIKLIVQSGRISEKAKTFFIQSVFEKVDAQTQYKILFDDNLIHIQNETPENQIEYLQKYLLKLDSISSYNPDSNYYKIKLLAQTYKITENVTICTTKISKI